LALQRLTDLKSATLELPDVILLDLNMPGMDGWGFLTSLQKVLPEINKKIKVIILSSSESKMERSRSLDFPFVSAYITKPVTLETIKTILSVI
jgi:CheY-like chemotaxis protein